MGDIVDGSFAVNVEMPAGDHLDRLVSEDLKEAGAGLGRDGTPWRLVGADPDPGAIVSAVAVGMLDDGRVDGRIAT